MDVRGKAEALLVELDEFAAELRDVQASIEVYRKRVREILGELADPGEAVWLLEEIRAFLARDGSNE
jgi:hypothetical protein